MTIDIDTMARSGQARNAYSAGGGLDFGPNAVHIATLPKVIMNVAKAAITMPTNMCSPVICLSSIETRWRKMTWGSAL